MKEEIEELLNFCNKEHIYYNEKVNCNEEDLDDYQDYYVGSRDTYSVMIAKLKKILENK